MGCNVRLLMIFASLLSVASVAACAPTNIVASTTQAAPARPVTASEGTILSMRLVTAQKTTLPWRSVLLADAGSANTANDASKTPLGQTPVVEFIVRTSRGTMLSVVQTDDADFHVGDRVVIVRGEQTHLTRPG